MSTPTMRRREPIRDGSAVEIRVTVSRPEYERLLARAKDERVTVARLLAENALLPQGRFMRAAVYELMAIRLLAQSVADSLAMLAIDGETEGYDVDAHDFAAHQTALAMQEITEKIRRVREG